jgi:hypothetical protein
VREVVAAEEPDEGEIASGVDADADGVVNAAIIEAAFHEGAETLDDVEVRHDVAVGRHEDARTAPLRIIGEDGHDARRDALDEVDALLL